MKTKPTYQDLEKELTVLRQQLLRKELNVEFTSFFQNNKAIMLQVDSVTKKIVDANDAAVNFYAYTKANLLQMAIGDLNILPAGEIDKRMKETVAQKSNFFHFQHKLANNEIKEVEVYVSPVFLNNKTYLLITVYDISERVSIENKLKEKQKLLKEAQQISKLGHWELDLVSNKLFWSDEIYRIFGLKPQGFLATYEAFIENIHSEDRGKVNEAYLNSLKTKKPYEIEHRLLLAKGDLKYVIEKCTTEFDTSGKAIRSIGTVQDITSRKKIEKELEKQNNELKILNATKDKFFSIIAHDLKSPFSSLLGFSELLLTNFDAYDVPKQKEFLTIIHQSVQHTYRLLENLLLWSRSQRGAIDFRPENENLFLVVEESLKLSKHLALKKLILVKNKIPKDIYVKADIDMLSTIVRNLISNAIKFTHREGKIEVEAHSICMNGSAKANYAEITVRDNGIGIAPEVQKKIFKITESVSTNGTENELGSGLGLILCKEFVEEHGGRIKLVSKMKEGSEFLFTIPLI